MAKACMMLSVNEPASTANMLDALGFQERIGYISPTTVNYKLEAFRLHDCVWQTNLNSPSFNITIIHLNQTPDLARLVVHNVDRQPSQILFPRTSGSLGRETSGASTSSIPDSN
jgi:hypothetical protein